MTRVAKIELKNWGPYYGDHSVELGEGVYAVLARRDDDEQRSNWQGKSWFVGSLRFALFGTHPATSEDGWISNGENKGHVRVLFTDGSSVTRSRKRGSSTQLEFIPPGGKVANQKLAQEGIEHHFGFVEEDWLMSCFFEQKEIARFIRARPAERTEIVNGWLDLGKLQDVEQDVRAELSVSSAELEVVVGDIRLAERELEERPDTETAESSDALRKTLESLSTELAEWRKLALGESDANAYRKMVKDGREIKTRVDQRVDAPGNLVRQQKKAEEAALEYRELRRKTVQIGNLMDGDFDGKCPVTCADCPVADTVREVGVRSKARYKRAEAEEKTAHGVMKSLAQLRDEFQLENTKDLTDRAELISMRDRARTLKGASKLGAYDAGNHDTVEQAHQQATYDLGVAVAKELGAEQATAIRERLIVDIADLVTRRAGLLADIETRREALAIVGRTGVQRDIANEALGEIEEGANALLRDCSIDLSVSVLWAREGKGLAVNCDQCGAPFPASQKVKECSKCQAARGPKLVEKLEIELSDFSGAAEDLAGIAFQLSAAHWLRRKRGADLAVAVIDEAFGALDARNRGQLSSHLSAMLRGRYGFEQALIVAHDNTIMDSLPKRVMITGSDTGSTVEVLT